MLAAIYLLAGVLAGVGAVWGLAGPWWALLTLAGALLALGLLETRGAATVDAGGAPPAGGDSR